jgi:LysM repeat protein|tara:strand:- start:940 stop:2832 length:1893 start_codon:yes stop_codon:yes gene_type:complete
MKIVIYLSFLFVFSFSCGALAQQQFKSHSVQVGETVFSIAKAYGIGVEDIYRLNPNAKDGVKINSILIVPDKDSQATINEDIKFEKHRVRRKETLFSISKKYDVSIDNIKRYNKELYSRAIKKGERLNIPIGLKDMPIVEAPILEADTVTDQKHTLEPKETKYGIARKYGITIAELEALNPGMGEIINIGTVINVPASAVIASAKIDEDFKFYEVKSKEGFFRLKLKLGLSEEEIVALNPYAKDGLKEGMILKIPMDNEVIDKVETVNLENVIYNKKKKRLAVILPFQLQKVGVDTINTDTVLIKKSGMLRVALDFYSGVLMAAEFAKDKGISVHLDVYDNEGSNSKTASIITKNDFSNVDAVIGPLRQKNVEKAVAMLRDSKTPIFSPLSNREIAMSSNFFQTLPTDEMLRKSMMDFLIANNDGKNVLLISDVDRGEQKAKILKALPNAITLSPREKGFLYLTDIDVKLSEEKENWVILESIKPGIISNTLGLLNGMPETFKIRLFTLDRNDAYEFHDVSNTHLAKLNFTFPSVNKSYSYKDKNPFVVSYKNKYGVYPNRYAVRGFDVTYDILLRLGSAEDVFESTENDYVTEYVENKFRYTKNSSRGYRNQAAYIIKYKDDLEFEIVE